MLMREGRRFESVSWQGSNMFCFFLLFAFCFLQPSSIDSIVMFTGHAGDGMGQERMNA